MAQFAVPRTPAASQAVATVVKTAGLEAKITAAEQRAEKAEKEAAALQERARLLEERAAETENSAKEFAARASTAEASIARAEGRADILVEQAKAAASAMERAVRSEEKLAAFGDLQAKMPALIHAVVGALARGGSQWCSGGMQGHYGLGPIKLELEEQDQPTADVCAVKLLEHAAAVGEKASDGVADTDLSGSTPGFMQRMLGGRRRDLKL